jgi:hypothetical protein
MIKTEYYNITMYLIFFYQQVEANLLVYTLRRALLKDLSSLMREKEWLEKRCHKGKEPEQHFSFLSCEVLVLTYKKQKKSKHVFAIHLFLTFPVGF